MTSKHRLPPPNGLLVEFQFVLGLMAISNKLCLYYILIKTLSVSSSASAAEKVSDWGGVKLLTISPSVFSSHNFWVLTPQTEWCGSFISKKILIHIRTFPATTIELCVTEISSCGENGRLGRRTRWYYTPWKSLLSPKSPGIFQSGADNIPIGKAVNGQSERIIGKVLTTDLVESGLSLSSPGSFIAAD